MGALMQALTIPGVPDWAVPAAIVHVTLFIVLILPVWRAFSRGGVPGPLALVLAIPLLGPLIVAVIFALKVLRVAAWSRLWALFIFVPVLNILFLWIFAFSDWSERETRRRQRASMIPSDERPSLGELPPRDARDDESAPRPAAPETPAAPPPKAKPAAGAPVDDHTLMPAQNKPADIPRRVTNPDANTGPSEKPPEKGPAQAPEKAPAKAPPVDGATLRGPAAANAGTGHWRVKGASPRSANLSLAIDEEDLSRREAGLVVGRSTRVDFTITDESVSRNHARFVMHGGVLCVEDMESMNGTKLEGVLLEPGTPAPISPGSTIVFGKVEVTVNRA